MNLELLVIGSKNFNNTIEEIKDNLEYSILFFDFNVPLYNVSPLIAGILVDSNICNNKTNLDLINKFKNKPILFLQNSNINLQNNFDNRILLPVSLLELKNKIKSLIASSKFKFNSSVKIKNYILNKNEKKLTKLNLLISLTEREVQLIELLFSEKKPLSKNFILQKIWKYSKDADTHTVETHIYRLRKKINDKFGDDNFILNSGDGYLI
jgi:hypothetical protein